MKPLNYAEMGILLRRHGMTVTHQVGGIAYVTHSDGTSKQYAIEHLRGAVRKPWLERLRDWIAGGECMKTLPLDIARCSGRFDLLSGGGICPHRDTCQRYLAFTQWDRVASVPDYRAIPVTMGAPECGIKIEVDA